MQKEIEAKEEFTVLCHTCSFRDTCEVLKVYSVIVYGCVCEDYKPKQELPNAQG